MMINRFILFFMVLLLTVPAVLANGNYAGIAWFMLGLIWIALGIIGLIIVKLFKNLKIFEIIFSAVILLIGIPMLIDGLSFLTSGTFFSIFIVSYGLTIYLIIISIKNLIYAIKDLDNETYLRYHIKFLVGSVLSIAISFISILDL